MTTQVWMERVAGPPRRGWEILVARFGTRNAVIGASAAGVVLLVLAIVGFAQVSGPRVPSIRVKRGPVTIKVTEAGELRAKDQVTVSAINDKQILWLCPEGKYVHAGDTLVVFESAKYVISSDEAHSSYLVARAELEQAQGDLEAQRSKEEAARQRYESLPELEKKGFVMASEVEQAKLAWQELRSNTKSKEASVKAAQANVDRAGRSQAQEERKLKEGVMLAPRAGLVVYATSGTPEEAKKISVGMVPFQGMDLMYLPDVSSMLVDTEIGEIDLARVKVGEAAAVTLDAFPGVTFKGEVVAIANLAKRKVNRATGKQTGAKVFDVTVKVLADDPRLKPGLTSTVEIICHQYENALTVPLEAVFYDENEKPIVYVRKHGKVEAREVEFSDSNERLAVVKKNLEFNDEVLLAPPGSL
ncbi:MAG TPA: efflux RND transporter periplasmic adaptor subunit [Methylomirabilota bacterium]|nr:efflux RND transporter periplasmic adaptor subunit [Methylomirabilota bacterium]